MGIDLDIISENLAELLTSVVNTTTKFYDIFVNPVAKDVSISVFNDQNRLVTEVIPNLAKSRQPLLGYTSPEGTVAGSMGQIYLDQLTGKTYIKTSGGSTSSGWNEIAVASSVESMLNNYTPPIPVLTLNTSGDIALEEGFNYKI